MDHPTLPRFENVFGGVEGVEIAVKLRLICSALYIFIDFAAPYKHRKNWGDRKNEERLYAIVGTSSHHSIPATGAHCYRLGAPGPADAVRSAPGSDLGIAMNPESPDMMRVVVSCNILLRR